MPATAARMSFWTSSTARRTCWPGSMSKGRCRTAPSHRSPANGVDPHRLYGSMELGAPDVLTAERHREIIAAETTG